MKKTFWIIIILYSSIHSEDIILKSGPIYRNIKIITQTENSITFEFNGENKILHMDKVLEITETIYNSNLQSEFLKPSYELLPNKFYLLNSPNSLVNVTIPNGDTLIGIIIYSNNSNVIYNTASGNVKIKKKSILSENKLSTNNKTYTVQKFYTNEYEELPLLILAIPGGIWAYSLFSDASDYSEAAELSRNLNLNNTAKELDRKSSQKLMFGIGVSVVSAIFAILAITPTKKILKQPIAIIPRPNGIIIRIKI